MRLEDEEGGGIPSGAEEPKATEMAGWDDGDAAGDDDADEEEDGGGTPSGAEAPRHQLRRRALCEAGA